MHTRATTGRAAKIPTHGDPFRQRDVSYLRHSRMETRTSPFKRSSSAQVSRLPSRSSALSWSDHLSQILASRNLYYFVYGYVKVRWFPTDISKDLPSGYEIEHPSITALLFGTKPPYHRTSESSSRASTSPTMILPIYRLSKCSIPPFNYCPSKLELPAAKHPIGESTQVTSLVKFFRGHRPDAGEGKL